MKPLSLTIVLSACLLVLAAGWWLTRTGAHPPVTVPANQLDSTLIPGEETVVHPTLPEEAAPAETVSLPADHPLPATDSGNPEHSPDLDQNRDWARKNPAAALAWLLNAPDGPQLEAVVEIVCSEMAQTNPAQAVALAERCRTSNTNFLSRLLDNLAQQWAEQDLSAAATWVAAQPAGEDQERLLGRIALVQSKTNPEAAARFVAEQMSPGPVQDEAAISVIYQWALRDANAARAWVQLFPEGKLRYRALQEVQNIQTVRKTMNQPAGS
jgi:hypothetical protein